MNRLLFAASLMFISFLGTSQNLEVDGQVKITQLDLNNSAGDVIIRLSDGTLGRRSVATLQTKKYAIGDFTQGGIVFWIDETGEHGLVCSIANLATNMRWFAGAAGLTHARGDGPGAGKLNTAIIISAQVAIGDDGSNYAARLCNEYQSIDIFNRGVSFNHGDWYLPSIGELGLIYDNRVKIDQTAAALSSFGGEVLNDATYWSSNESTNFFADIYIFSNGLHGGQGKATTEHVRAVRTF